MSNRPGPVPELVAYHPAHFAQWCSGGKWQFEGVPHLAMVSNALRDVALGKIDRLMIEAPPRHGKSMLVSQYFPAWYIGASRTGRVILTSYEADFAADWGRKVRDLLEEFGGDIFGVGVSQNSSARNRWDLDGYGGGMITAGAGGPILGKGANVLIIDDPVKNAQEAFSKTRRETVWNWYRSTAMTRLEPGGSVVLIMQRWHEDDLAGRLLANEGRVEEGGRWTVLTFRALAEEGDILGRPVGEALWPERFPAEVLIADYKKDNEYWFSAQYQQRPQPLEGGLFQRSWIRYFYPSSEPTEFSEERVLYLDGPEIPTRVKQSECSTFITVDLAASLKESADYTVATVFRTTPMGELLIEDVIRRRISGPDQVPMLFRLNEHYRPYAFYIEKTAYQITAVQAARMAGLPVIEVDPRGKGPKEVRAIPAAETMRAGKIYLRSYASWNEPFVEELLEFPTGRHDDQVDTLSMAVENMVLSGGYGPLVDEHLTYETRGPFQPKQLFN